MNKIAYVRRPQASVGLPKRVLITVVGDYWYDGGSRINRQSFERCYSPEIMPIVTTQLQVAQVSA